MTTVKYEVPNISCGHCVHTITHELSQLAGVQKVNASKESKQVEVDFGDPATEESIQLLLAEINYPIAR
jgi:copper chaperone CopZ